MSRESHLELKVGVFVLAAVIVLGYLVASVSNLSFMEKGHSVQAVFGFANGLKEAAPVRLAGVEAGIVKKLEVFVDDQDQRATKVRVNLWIKQGVKLPVDSKVTINQLGLLGEKYVEIIPGQSGEFLNENGVIVGKDPIPVERVTEQVNRLADQMELTLDKVNNGVLSENNQKSFAGALKGVNDLVEGLNHGRGTAGKLLSDDAVYQNLEELTVDLKKNPWKLLYRPKK